MLRSIKSSVLQNSVKPIGTQKELAKTAGVSHDTIHKVENQKIAGKNYGENHPKQEVSQNSAKPLEKR